MQTLEVNEMALISLIERTALTNIWEKGCVTAGEIVEQTQKAYGSDYELVESLLAQHLPEMLDAYCLEIQYLQIDDVDMNLTNIEVSQQVITLDSSWWSANLDSKPRAGGSVESGLYSDELALSDWFQYDVYAQQYGEEYTTKIENLKEWLIHKETGEGQFRVISVEAGLGKSLYANRIIQDHIESFWLQTHRKFLIVKPFNEDIRACEQFIGENDTMGRHVLGITKDNWSEWRDKQDSLEKFDVLIISHKRYIDLCLDESTRKAFTDGRHTLVIDEKVNFPMYTFSEQHYRAVQAALPWELEEVLMRVVKPLRELMNNLETRHNSNNSIIPCTPNIDEQTFREFEQLVQSNRHKILFKNLSLIDDFMAGLDVWYTTRCLYSGNSITGFHRQHSLWGLQNNIVLDANGGIDHTYKTSYISVVRQTAVLDHGMSTLHWIKCNSGKGYITEHVEEYMTEICQRIKECQTTDDRILIVTHKAHVLSLSRYLTQAGLTDVGVGDEYCGQSIAINYYGNLIGRNLYADFTKCWIVGTPNIPMLAHIVHHSQYTKKDVRSNPYVMKRGEGMYKFADQELEKVRLGYVVGEIYQALRRVQRNPTPTAEIFLVCQSELLLEEVLKLLPGINVGSVVELLPKATKEGGQPSLQERLVSLLKSLQPGAYKKSYICELVGISKPNLRRYLKAVEVSNLAQAGLIRIENKTIVRLE